MRQHSTSIDIQKQLDRFSFENEKNSQQKFTNRNEQKKDYYININKQYAGNLSPLMKTLNHVGNCLKWLILGVVIRG